MAYADYLRELLRPLGVYDLSPASAAGAEAEALGAAMDDFFAFAAEKAGQMLLSTATEEGLSRMEALFPFPLGGGDFAARRKALTAFLQVNGDSFTPAALDFCLAACGTACRTDEMDGPGTVGISFPNVMGEPEQFGAKKRIIESLLPCHLAPIYRLAWCTWQQLQAQNFTFAALENMTFLELSVLELS